MHNLLNNLSLVFLMTTGGHHGWKGLYKYTLSYLNKYYGFENFGGLYAHCKVYKEQDNEFLEMAKCLPKFNIIKKFSNKILPDNIHANPAAYNDYYLNDGYLGDLVRICSFTPLFDTEFLLWNEDDSIPMFKNNNYHEFLYHAYELLRSNDDLFSVQFNGAMFPLEHNDLFSNFFPVTDHLSLRPLICKTQKFLKAAEIIKLNFDKVKFVHSENLFKAVLTHLNPNFKVAEFNAKYAWQVHIGELKWPTIREEYNLTLE